LTIKYILNEKLTISY